MNKDMPSIGKDPAVNKYRIAELRREIKRMQAVLDRKQGVRMILRFRIRWYMINLRHELKQLK